MQFFSKGVWWGWNNGAFQNFRTHRTRLRVSDESRMTKTVCGCRVPAGRSGSAPVRLCSPVWICSELTADISPEAEGFDAQRPRPRRSISQQPPQDRREITAALLIQWTAGARQERGLRFESDLHCWVAPGQPEPQTGAVSIEIQHRDRTVRQGRRTRDKSVQKETFFCPKRECVSAVWRRRHVTKEKQFLWQEDAAWRHSSENIHAGDNSWWCNTCSFRTIN